MVEDGNAPAWSGVGDFDAELPLEMMTGTRGWCLLFDLARRDLL